MSEESRQLKKLLAARERGIAALEQAARLSAASQRLQGAGLYYELNRLIGDLLQVDISMILLYDPEEQALVAQAPALGLADELVRAYRIPLHEGSRARGYWEKGEPLILSDLASHPLVRELKLAGLARAAGVRSTMAVGLRHEGRLVGIIQPANKRDGSDFQADDLRLLTIFARQAAITIQNAQLLDQMEHQVAEMATLYRMASLLTEAVSLDELLHKVLAQVRRVLEYDTCLICLATRDDRALRIEAVDGEGAAMGGLEVPVDAGINAWIYRHGAPLLVSDANLDPRRLHIQGKTEGIRAAAGVPLVVEGRTIGTIYASRREPGTFTEAHLEFLTFTATHVAAAVERARLLDQAGRRAEEMETLLQVAAAMALDLDLEHVLQTVYEQASRIMDTSAFFVALYDPDGDELRFVLLYDRNERLEPFAIRFSQSRGLTAHVIRSGQPMLVRNWELERETMAVEPLLVGDAAQSWLGVPVVVHDEVLGVVGAQSYEPYAFTGRHLRLLSGIASQAGISLQNVKLVADLKLVNTDLQEMVTAQAHLLQALDGMGDEPAWVEPAGAQGRQDG